MRVFAAWDVPDELRNELLRHLHEFEVAHPGCGLEVFITGPSTPPVSIAAVLREPGQSVTQVRERLGPDGPQLSPIERATEALRANPGRSEREIARQIGVGHQTVARAKKKMGSATAAAVVQSRNGGPHGPERRRS